MSNEDRDLLRSPLRKLFPASQDCAACVAEVVYDKDVLSFRIAFCNPDYSLLSFANFAAEEDTG